MLSIIAKAELAATCCVLDGLAHNTVHTSPILWSKTNYITAPVITLHTSNPLNSHSFSNYPFLANIYIT